ncbi:transcription initiation factor TFIID subunit 3 isoform X2 [Phlebotomus papatasi]|uniref:transcription initiation factor TFIID subunit 3 isoform X2 n=1 Tax=Phlebotomus papatasi TaxID=29031 RepID=UPI0024840048|nr:transcription initiation factor TFIID subunit 3 isoform X2 [Phlebotomus papatasi]
MSEAYSHQVLRTVVAQICQTIGWHSIQSGTLDILVDTAKRYIQALGHETHRFTELAQRTEPNLDDLAEAFNDWRVNYADIIEYVKNVSPEECAIKVPKYPAKKADHLNFLKPGSKEVITRPVHIPDYLPPMLPEQEEEDTKVAEKENQRRDGEIDVVSVSPKQTPPVKTQPEFVAPTGAPRARFSTQTGDEEVGRAVRENTSVIMTTSGFISPSRAGKLPEAKLSVDISELLHQLLGPEIPPPMPKPYPGPSGAALVAKASVLDHKEADLTSTPMLAVPSPLNIASANPEKFDVKVKNRKTAEKKPPGEAKPRKKSGQAHGHRIPKEGQPRKVHTSKKMMRVMQEQQMRQQPPPQDIQVPMDLATVKKIAEQPLEAPCVEGKISAEPDKLKMNIFKRISSSKVAGVKEEKVSLVDEPINLDPDLRIIPQTPESPTVPKKRQNTGRNTEPKERKKPKTERVSKKQKMLMNQPPLADNPMRFDFNFPGQGGGDYHPAPLPMAMETKNPSAIPIFPPQQHQQQPPRSSPAPHNLFNLFNFSSSPGLIPPPSLFGNPFGLHPQQPPGSLHFPAGGMRGPNPFNLMPLSRFPPINPPVPPSPPALPKSLVPPAAPPDKSQCNVAPLVPESLKLEPLILNMSTNTVSTSSPSLEPKQEPVSTPPEEDEEAKRRKMEKKVKKKKEKKEKTKDKEKKREEKRALKEAMKVSKAKEKREKKKEKERSEREGAVTEENVTSIPKLTLKLGAAHSPKPSSPDGGRKLTIKPIKREPGISGETDGGEMPELARISPLVTRPPKPKSPNQSFGHGFFQHSPTGSGLPSTPGGSGGKGFGVSLSAPPADHMKTPTSSLTPLPTRGRPRGTGNKQHTATATAAPATPGVSPGLNLSVETSLLPEKLTNNSVRDADGNQVWICPACGRVDDGTPMIGCDGCDAWYHWVCVGIQVPPDATEDWYCRVCIVKKQEMQVGGGGSGSEKKKKRKRRDKKQQV